MLKQFLCRIRNFEKYILLKNFNKNLKVERIKICVKGFRLKGEERGFLKLEMRITGETSNDPLANATKTSGFQRVD